MSTDLPSCVPHALLGLDRLSGFTQGRHLAHRGDEVRGHVQRFGQMGIGTVLGQAIGSSGGR
ncbi:MAG: hypothetical protein WD990_13475, partial [Acidimicrobiia bacterium]